MSSNNTTRTLVSAAEEHKIDRAVISWLKSCPSRPAELMQYEALPTDTVGMALSTIQGTYITKRYLYGGYQAEYQFKIIYRVKPGNSIDKRLQAVELLDEIGDWASEHKPIIEGVSVRKVEVTARASMFGRYENGDEDYQVLMKMTYEVI